MALKRLSTRQVAVLRAQARAGSAVAQEAVNSIDNENGINGTVAPITLFVADTGSDRNPGTLTRPFRHPQAALDSLPKRIRHLVNINIGTGNFDGFIEQGFNIEAETPGAFAGINIQGTYAQVVPSTGTGSGTLTTSVTGAVIGVVWTVVTDSTQSWTIDEFKGRLFHVQSGTGIGSMFPILSNTATTITLSSVSAVGTTSQYRIVDCTSAITTAVRTMPSIQTSTQTTTNTGLLACVHVINNQTSRGSTCLRIEGLKFAPVTASTFTGFNIQGGLNLAIARCQLSSNGLASFTMFSIGGASSVSIQQCYVDSSSTGVNVTGPFVNIMTVSNCYLKCAFPIGIGGGSCSVGVFTCLFEMPGSAIGVNMQPATGSNLTLSTIRMTGNNSQAIRIPTSNTNGFSTILISNVIITQGTAGLEILGPHYIHATGLNITGCARAIDPYHGARLRIDATSVATGTTADVALDGVFTDLATMRALSPKVMKNDYGTVFYE